MESLQYLEQDYYTSCRKDNQLKFTSYFQLGGIGGTLNQRATKVYNSLSKQEQEIAKHIFLCLTQLGEGTEDTRRRVLKRDFFTDKYTEKLVERVVKRLADEKLIVTSKQMNKSLEGNREVIVDVAHETLIRNWLLLKQWLDKSRISLLERREIEAVALTWRKQKYKPDYLIQGKRLRKAKDFKKEQNQKYPLSELAESFITESIKHQRNERIKSLGLLLIIPLIGTGIYGIAIGGHFLAREIQLNAGKKLIRECQGEKDCDGRIQTLEKLVNAKRSLKLYNLSDTNLVGIQLSGANLSGANLSGALLIELADLLISELGPQEANFTALIRSKIIRTNNLTSAQIKSACHWKTSIYKVDEVDENDEKANQKYIEELKQDEASNPIEP